MSWKKFILDYDEVDNYKKLPLDVITITLNSMLQQGFLKIKVFFKIDIRHIRC